MSPKKQREIVEPDPFDCPDPHSPVNDIQVRDVVRVGNGRELWTVGEIVDRPRPVANLIIAGLPGTKTHVELSELLLVQRFAA